MKFGIGSATSDAAHEVRDGHLTPDGEFPENHYPNLLDCLGITATEFWYVGYKFRRSNI